MKANRAKIVYRNQEELEKEYQQLRKKNQEKDEENRCLQRKFEMEQRERERLERQNAEMEEEIKVLKLEIARLHGILNLDGTNSGTPTSQTPMHKKKVIPNTRTKSGKGKGGQSGHAKAKLHAFRDEEVTEDVYHECEVCPHCGGELEKTGEICKDELDYEVVVIRRRHHYLEYVCSKCGQKVRQTIPAHLKEENQYGSQTQALALSLMNIGNVSMNKVRRMICGLSEGEVHPTEGYIAKLQCRAAGLLQPFLKELKQECLQRKTLHWDDTVIMIDKKRGCLRFYGDEQIALYCAHQRKNKEGIDDDDILPQLPKTTNVMHDHNLVNYHTDYDFTNIECNQHLLRDLQKVTDTLPRTWPGRMKEHIQRAIHDRNQLLEAGKRAFDQAYTDNFFSGFNQIMIQAISEYYAADEDSDEEFRLIMRLLEYKNNYFAWITCFDLPVTNNTSERALRGSKTHMKVSGQFLSEAYAQYYAAIQSYIETCKRNGINEMSALVRLCQGDPLSLKDILNHPLLAS